MCNLRHPLPIVALTSYPVLDHPKHPFTHDAAIIYNLYFPFFFGSNLTNHTLTLWLDHSIVYLHTIYQLICVRDIYLPDTYNLTTINWNIHLHSNIGIKEELKSWKRTMASLPYLRQTIRPFTTSLPTTLSASSRVAPSSSAFSTSSIQRALKESDRGITPSPPYPSVSFMLMLERPR